MLDNIAENFFTKFETRFGRKEKDKFLDYCTEEFKKLGYNDDEIMIQKSIFGKNLIAGPPDADILVTAHYDNWGGVFDMFSGLPLSRNQQFVSAYERIMPRIESDMQNAIDNFLEQ